MTFISMRVALRRSPRRCQDVSSSGASFEKGAPVSIKKSAFKSEAAEFCSRFSVRAALWVILAMMALTAGFRLPVRSSTRAGDVIPGLVAAYGFNELGGPTTADASGAGNVGTLLGGATRITTGKYGNAISFDGINAAVRIPDSPSWKVNGSSTYTIGMWVKVKDVDRDYQAAIGMGAWPADNLHIYKLGVAWVYKLNTSGVGCVGKTADLSYLTAADGEYHHIALVLNSGVGRCDFYSDGQVVGTGENVSGTTSFTTGPESNDLFIGGLDGGNQYIKADIDEVRLYTKALTETEIRSEMNRPLEDAPAPDRTPPAISGVDAAGITASGATISWATDEPSDSLVEYGTTTAYGASTTMDTKLVVAHPQPLAGLSPGTSYHYRLHSKDAAGNEAVSVDGAFTTASVPSGVVAAYGFNELSGPTTADASGAGNVGTLLGGATRITTGKYGNAISFDGVNAAVRIPDSPSWKVNGSTTYTISMWVKVKDVDRDYQAAIGMGAWPADNLHIYKLGVAWIYNLNTSALGCAGKTADLSYLTAADGEYHHIALVLNSGVGRCDFYSDGQVVGTGENVSGTTSFMAANGSNDLFIGGLEGGNQYIKADIDEVRLYTKALTEAEIRSEMNRPVEDAPAPDRTPPAISGVSAAGITTNGATISWATDEPSDSLVEYGTTTAYGSSTTLDP